MKDIARDTSPRFVPNILGSSCYTGCCKSEWTLKKLKQADCRKILQIEPKYPVECKSSNCTIQNEGYCLIFPFLPSCVNFSYVADSAQTEYCSTFHCSSVRPCVTGVTSHISHIYKGINSIFWFKIILSIFVANTRPDKNIVSALTDLTIDFDWSKELSKR